MLLTRVYSRNGLIRATIARAPFWNRRRPVSQKSTEGIRTFSYHSAWNCNQSFFLNFTRTVSLLVFIVTSLTFIIAAISLHIKFYLVALFSTHWKLVNLLWKFGHSGYLTFNNLKVTTRKTCYYISHFVCVWVCVCVFFFNRLLLFNVVSAPCLYFTPLYVFFFLEMAQKSRNASPKKISPFNYEVPYEL